MVYNKQNKKNNNYNNNILTNKSIEFVFNYNDIEKINKSISKSKYNKNNKNNKHNNNSKNKNSRNSSSKEKSNKKNKIIKKKYFDNIFKNKNNEPIILHNITNYDLDRKLTNEKNNNYKINSITPQNINKNINLDSNNVNNYFNTVNNINLNNKNILKNKLKNNSSLFIFIHLFL